MAGNAFTQIGSVYTSSTFRAWFDKTNEIIFKLNPLEIYGITNGTGITYEVDGDGIATIALDLPSVFGGDFSFQDGVTFEGSLNISGSTVDFGGATLYGKVVRSVNGQTGDVVFSTVSTPTNAVTGDILFYTPGGTWDTYSLFSDGPVDANRTPFHIGGSGGVFIGTTSGGPTAASFIKEGELQIVGKENSYPAIYMTNPNVSGLITNSGVFLTYENSNGSHLFKFQNKSLLGANGGSPLTIDFTKRTAIVGGNLASSATGDSALIINDNNSSKPIQYHDANGSTFTIRYLDASESSGRTSGGFAGLEGGSPETKGFREDKRLRLEQNFGSVEVELGNDQNSGFVVYGVTSTYGGAFKSPVIAARTDGSVVVGGIDSTDGGTTQSSWGSLNVASGRLLVGGTMGSQTSSGYQVLVSNGITAGWASLTPSLSSFSGSLSEPSNAVINSFDQTVSITETSSEIVFRDSNGNFLTGELSATINLPVMLLGGGLLPPGSSNGVIGVGIKVDGEPLDYKFVTWKDLYQYGAGAQIGTPINLSFTFSKEVSTRASMITFSTNGGFNSGFESFQYISPGNYLIQISNIG